MQETKDILHWIKELAKDEQCTCIDTTIDKFEPCIRCNAIYYIHFLIQAEETP